MSSKPTFYIRKNWLIPVDDSIWSYHAFMSVNDMIKQRNEIVKQFGFEPDHLYVLHVTQPLSGITKYFKSMTEFLTPTRYQEIEEEHRKNAKKILAYYGRIAQQNQLNFTLLQSLAEKPSSSIVECCKKYAVNHVVLGQGGSIRFLKKYLLGSTCRECLEEINHSNVTVIKQAYEDEMTEDHLAEIISEQSTEELCAEDDRITDEHPFACYEFSSKETCFPHARKLDDVTSVPSKEREEGKAESIPSSSTLAERKDGGVLPLSEGISGARGEKRGGKIEDLTRPDPSELKGADRVQAST